MSEERKHTKEPWKQHGVELIGAEGTPQGRVICSLSCGHLTGAPRFSFLNNEHREHEQVVMADAARIVACVNALAGIPDPEAFVGKVLELSGRINDCRHECLPSVRNINDELRAMLPKR